MIPFPPTTRTRAAQVVFGLALLLPIGCGQGAPSGGSSGSAGASKPTAAPIAVKIAPARLQPLSDEVGVFGVLAPQENVALSFRVAGRLARLDLDIGSRVREGEVVAALDPVDLDLAVEQARALVTATLAQLGLRADESGDSLDLESTAAVRSARASLLEARQNRDRVRELVDGNLRPRSELDSADAAFAVAESRLQQAIEQQRTMLAELAERRVRLALAERARSEAEIRAPFDAVVAERTRRPPEVVAIGETVLRLVQIHPLRLQLRVPERHALRLQLGQEVAFQVDGLDTEFRGTIERTSPSIDGVDRTLPVEVVVANVDGRLRPGAFARARIAIADPQPRVVVPSATLVRFAGSEKVFVVEDGVARVRAVRSGREIDDVIEIETGLRGDESLILAPRQIVDGDAVTVSGGGN
ncbi:MAG: efflux RND transporter periplasmic adaptor subunit [Planctomycetota bacterium]